MNDFKTNDNIKYIGQKSKYFKTNQVYRVKSTLKCAKCGDELVELYGFSFFEPSYCRFCNTPILKTCFSASRFSK